MTDKNKQCPCGGNIKDAGSGIGGECDKGFNCGVLLHDLKKDWNNPFNAYHRIEGELTPHEHGRVKKDMEIIHEYLRHNKTPQLPEERRDNPSDSIYVENSCQVCGKTENIGWANEDGCRKECIGGCQTQLPEEQVKALDMIEKPIIQIYQPTNTLSLHLNCSYERACKNIETIRQCLSETPEEKAKRLNPIITIPTPAVSVDVEALKASILETFEDEFLDGRYCGGKLTKQGKEKALFVCRLIEHLVSTGIIKAQGEE